MPLELTRLPLVSRLHSDMTVERSLTGESLSSPRWLMVSEKCHATCAGLVRYPCTVLGGFDHLDMKPVTTKRALTRRVKSRSG
jgi:hypothetical protein